MLYCACIGPLLYYLRSADVLRFVRTLSKDKTADKIPKGLAWVFPGNTGIGDVYSNRKA